MLEIFKNGLIAVLTIVVGFAVALSIAWLSKWLFIALVFVAFVALLGWITVLTD